MTDHNDVFTNTEPPPWLSASDEENPSSSTNWRFRAAPVLGVPGFVDPDGFDDIPSPNSAVVMQFEGNIEYDRLREATLEKERYGMLRWKWMNLAR